MSCNRLQAWYEYLTLTVYISIQIMTDIYTTSILHRSYSPWWYSDTLHWAPSRPECGKVSNISTSVHLSKLSWPPEEEIEDGEEEEEREEEDESILVDHIMIKEVYISGDISGDIMGSLTNMDIQIDKGTLPWHIPIPICILRYNAHRYTPVCALSFSLARLYL